MPADIPQREHDAIKTVAARLATAFPQTPAAHIDQSVDQAYHRFDGSRVRTFVPVLVEHAVREELAMREEVADRGTSRDNSAGSPVLETSN